MGRASSVAFMPTSSISGGSPAPMENSPPGIQTIPSGARRGAGSRFSTVGWNSLVVVGASDCAELVLSVTDGAGWQPMLSTVAVSIRPSLEHETDTRHDFEPL